MTAVEQVEAPPATAKVIAVVFWEGYTHLVYDSGHKIAQCEGDQVNELSHTYMAGQT